MCDELDIYDDLDDFQKVEDEKSKELQAWETKYANAQVEISNYQMQNKALEKKIKTMEVNFQNLLDTAKAEIKRKDTMITQLRKEKDDICFRRKWPNKSEPAESNQKTEQKRILKQEESAKAMSDVAGKSEKREKVTKDEKETPAKLEDKLKSQNADCDKKKDNRHSKQPSSNKSSHHRSVDTCRNRDRSRRRTRSRSRSRSRHRDWNRREARKEKKSTGSSRTRSTKDSYKRRRSNSRSRSRSGSSQHSHNNKIRKNSCSGSVSSRERESNLATHENRNKARPSEMHSGKTTKQVNPTEETSKEHTAKVNEKNKEERCTPTDQLALQNPSAEDSQQIGRKAIDHSSNIIDNFPEINLKAENNQVKQDAERDSFEGKPIDKSEDTSSRGAPGENESKEPSASLTHAFLMIPGLDLVNCEEHNMESIRCPKDALKIKICEPTVKNSDRTAEEVLSKEARNDQEETELTNAGKEIPNKSAPTKVESEVPKSEIEECKDAKITDETPKELRQEDKLRDYVDQSLLPEESDRKDEQFEVFDKDIGSEDLPILNDDKPQLVECPLALDTMVDDSIQTSERKYSSKDLEDMNLCTPPRNVSPIIEHSREDDIATPERHVSSMPSNSDNEALLSDGELHSTQPREVANMISIVEPPPENNIVTQQGETRSATGIQIIEDIRLPVMMDIEHIALRVDGLNEDSQDKNESEYATENANVEHNKQQFVEKARKIEDSNVEIIVDKKIELELVVTTSLLPKPAIVASTVMYAQPDSTKVDHNEDDQNEEAAIKSASLPEDTSEKSFDIDYSNTSLEADNIEVALKHLHHQSHTSVEEQPDEATVSSTSMKTPKQDLLKILTQSPVQQPAAASGNAVSHYPKKLKNKMKKTGVRTASERKTPIKPKSSSITPEKGDTTPLKKRKINLDHKDDEIVLQSPSETAIAASPPAVNVTIEETLNASGLEQDKSCGSDSSIVTKRCSLGHSDYQFERINDEVVLRVTRRGRRRRVAPSGGNET